jgi:hypothetical protein
MTVSLTVAKTMGGAGVSDALAGGGTGLDFGQVTNSEYVPIINQTANTGHQNLYISGDHVVDPITDVKTYIALFSQTYGGANSAAADYATLKAKGQADNENTANNSDGLASGLRIEHNGFGIAGLGASAFLPSRAQVDIYGNNGTDGIDLASAFDMHVDAMVYDNSSVETDASAPVTGKIGKSGDSVLGDYAHIGLRYYLESAAVDGGILQANFNIGFSYTA